MTGQTFRQLWRDAIRDSDDPELDPIAVAVAMALDRHMDANGRTHTGQHKLARLAKLRTTETVVARVDVLEATGWLEVDRPERSGGRTHYQATIPASDRPTRSDGSDRPRRSDGSSGEPSDATGPRPSDATGPTVRRGRTDPVDPEEIIPRGPELDTPAQRPASDRRPAEEETMNTNELPPVGEGLELAHLWPVMAERTHENLTAADQPPPRAGARRRAWLRTVAASLAEEHADHARELLADYERGASAEAVIRALEPDLARHDPVAAAADWAEYTAKLERWERTKATPEEAAEAAEAARRELRRSRRQGNERDEAPVDPELEADRLVARADELGERAAIARAAGDHALADACARALDAALGRAEELSPSPPALIARRTPAGLVIEHLEAAAG